LSKKNKRTAIAPHYKNGIFLTLLSILSLFFIFYFYSRNTSTENEIFINPSLYSLAVIVLFAFFISISFFLIGIKNAFFSKKYYESNPSKLIYYIQSSLKSRNNKILFILISTVYFILFGFLSNLFIFFNNDGTIFSLSLQQSSNHVDKGNNKTSILHNHKNNIIENDIKNLVNDYYPKYNLIICCNSLGYVPMIIFSISNNFSILLIPINFLLGIVISILVGLNLTLNIYLLKQINSLKLSRRNFFSFLGISSGLFVGCPTCAGSFFYSLAGFSSLITFSYLSIYQIIFVAISIPLLIMSIIVMAKLMRIKYLDHCKINN